MSKESVYILKRIIKAKIQSIPFYICRIFPIDKKKIVFCCIEGTTGYSCNPKYIAEECIRRNQKKLADFKLVWLVNDMTKNFPQEIKVVKNTLWNRAYWLTRSKIWIDNYRKPYGTVKRKGQYYLNTNHYTIGIKCTGLWRADGFSKMAYLVSKNDSDMIDDLVIDSAWCEEVSPKGLVYEGTYLKTGAPRCDVLFGDRSFYQKKFRQKHNLPEDAKVVMFAPTFREGAKDGKRFVFSEIWSIDFKRLIKNLEKKFGGKWYLCVRVHPQLAPTFREYKNPDVQDRIIDESQADDMYEILAGMDAYITDYSSACFEAGFAHIPVFLYADDIQQYANDRGALMWNLATDERDHISNNKQMVPGLDVYLPFTLASDNEQLEQDIMAFDQSVFDKKLDEFHEKMGLVFDGRASENIAKRIKVIL